jgi:hypothetical protein
MYFILRKDNTLSKDKIVNFVDFKNQRKDTASRIVDQVVDLATNTPNASIADYLSLVPTEHIGEEHSEVEVRVLVTLARATIGSVAGVIPVQKVLEQQNALKDMSRKELVTILRANRRFWTSRVVYFTALLDQIEYLEDK